MSVKLFEEYLEDGIAKTQSPDFSRAKSLQKEAEQSRQILEQFIDKIGVNDNNANYIIKNAYDIILELVRAKMLKEGFNTSGKGAHEAEVSYLRKMGLKEKDVEFADSLRYFRNGILYYGKSFDTEYAQKVLDFVEKVYSSLLAK
jgi:hypothetical protein